jgi:hypothetical protein
VVPTVPLVARSFLNVPPGGQSLNDLPRVLWSDLALMERIGFNAHQCENGYSCAGRCQPTDKKRSKGRSPPCLADNSGQISQEERERHLQMMARVIARGSFFRGKLVVALDGRNILTPQSSEGWGKGKVTGQKEPVSEKYSLIWVETSRLD